MVGSISTFETVREQIRMSIEQGSARADHGALMDRIYRWQRPIYDVTRKYYLLGRDRLIADLEPPEAGRVLELGCGTARNLILAAVKHPTARFYGVDISAEMLASARKAIDRAGLSHRITVARGDAAAFDPMRLFQVSAFDRVFLSYTVSMIPPWRDAICAGADVLAPDGRLSLVDFGAMERYPPIARRLLCGWLTAFHVSPRAGLRDVLATCAQTLDARADIQSLYGGYAVYGRLIRRATA